MRTRGTQLALASASLAAFALLTAPVHALPSALASPESEVVARDIASSPVFLARRDGMHEHGHGHAAPLTEINETLILQWHKPTPPSYGTHDFDDKSVTSKHPGLMGLHALFMSLAFFGALPIGIALRSVNHAWHAVSVAAFYVFAVLGVSCSALYSKLTPNMYEGAVHGKQGYFALLFAGVLTTVDALSAMKRAYRYFSLVRSGDQEFSVKKAWRTVVLNKSSELDLTGVKAYDHEYTGLVHSEPEYMEMDVHELKAVTEDDLNTLPPTPTDEGSSHGQQWAAVQAMAMRQARHHRASEWRQSVASDGTLFHPTPSPRGSHHSDETLHELPVEAHSRSKYALAHRIGRGIFATAERVLVFIGYMNVLTGIVTYTGGCRDSYVNGCLAHLIKGGIFWCYGLVTWARFLGSFSELGWAWNRSPRSANVPTAEFVESTVIFIYGITNTWMERFGVPAGSPFSTKEVQHISIAVMFWFAGLVGMGIESKRIRRWLSAPAALIAASVDPSVAQMGSMTVAPPVQYLASFNPFPALVIGVTGAAMSAHAQVYLFQVQIHALWGFLLAAFAVLRCLTYFFLWLGPPKSILPSRPPTEALASFCLACGGLMFQFSTEELTLAAMRRGRDDQMMFLNVAVAFTCFAFTWALGIVTFKGWLKARQMAAAKLSASS